MVPVVAVMSVQPISESRTFWQEAGSPALAIPAMTISDAAVAVINFVNDIFGLSPLVSVIEDAIGRSSPCRPRGSSNRHSPDHVGIGQDTSRPQPAMPTAGGRRRERNGRSANRM